MAAPTKSVITKGAKFYTGEGFSAAAGKAKVFASATAAQTWNKTLNDAGTKVAPAPEAAVKAAAKAGKAVKRDTVPA